MDSRERAMKGWQAIRQACNKSHKSGPGGSRICICGAACGGSEACNGLYDIRLLLSVAEVPPDYKELLDAFKVTI